METVNDLREELKKMVDKGMFNNFLLIEEYPYYTNEGNVSHYTLYINGQNIKEINERTLIS